MFLKPSIRENSGGIKISSAKTRLDSGHARSQKSAIWGRGTFGYQGLVFFFFFWQK